MEIDDFIQLNELKDKIRNAKDKIRKLKRHNALLEDAIKLAEEQNAIIDRLPEVNDGSDPLNLEFDRISEELIAICSEIERLTGKPMKGRGAATIREWIINGGCSPVE